ncbi:hypothetical protein AB0C13_24355 [Streptomyces sp. NPDC049099]|uniref:RCC1 domain-containing protein n=1 Tax=Streptomyces sp. NPDC049099 TaxID=3155768 RepID=UPI00342F707D
MRTLRGSSWGARIAAVCTAAMLGLFPGAWLSTAHADNGRSDVPGAVVSWGINQSGQLGQGTVTNNEPIPNRVCGSASCSSQLDHVIAVSGGGGHSLALRSDGTVLAWGSNFRGQLGNGTTTDTTTPVQVCAPGQTAPCSQFLTGIVAISAGGRHSLALNSDGRVFAWGGNDAGQLGDGTNTDRNVPVQLLSVSGVQSISAGAAHSLVSLNNGTARSWGENIRGELGDGTTTNSNVPVTVSGLTNVQSVAAGGLHSLAALTDGTARSWGGNVDGQLGDGTFTDSSVPVTVSGLTNVQSVSAGRLHSTALLTDGTVRAWGNNGFGQLGNGTTVRSNIPVQVIGLSTVQSLSSHDGDHNLALLNDGTVRAWGDDLFGQIGDGGHGIRSTPQRVCAPGQSAPCAQFLSNVTAVSTGADHSLAIVRPSADVAIAKSAIPEPVRPNRNLTYTLTVSNHGPNTADNVVVTDDLPSNARFVSVTPSQGSCQAPPVGSTDSVRCSLGSLANSASSTTQIVVTVRANRNTTVTNTANVTTSTPDPVQSNNSVTIETPVS